MNQGVEGFGGAGKQADANAGGVAEVFAVDLQGDARVAEDAAGDAKRLLLGGAVEQEDVELVAADTGDDVVLPEAAANAVGYFAEQQVADLVGVAVVDLLEAVQIDVEESDRVRGPTRSEERR